MVKHVDHVPFSPDRSVAAVFVEESVVSVLAFRDVPFVEVLAHHHESHLVAELDKFFCRHIVGSSDSIATHVLEDGELSADRRLVYCSSERSEIMVQTYSADFSLLSVEEESLVRPDFDCPESEACADLVLKFGTMLYADCWSDRILCSIDRSSKADLCACIVQFRVLR